MKFEETNDEIFAYGNNYLVEPVERATVTKGGIHIPETAAQRIQTQGTVRELGTGDGPWHARVGDRVVYGVHAGGTVLIGGKPWKLLGVNDITAVIRAGSQTADGGMTAALSTRPAGEGLGG